MKSIILKGVKETCKEEKKNKEKVVRGVYKFTSPVVEYLNLLPLA